MAGLRLINTMPETFRFPEWRDDVYYVADSMVRYASYMSDSDSDIGNLTTQFYIAKQDIPAGSGNPAGNTTLWSRQTADADFIDSIENRINERDSDILVLEREISLLQIGAIPELEPLQNFDSDLKVLFRENWDFGVVF